MELKESITIPYTPQQNFIVERKNRTLMKMARCMLHARNMDPMFWAETINTTPYIINRSPTIVFKHKTAKEAWSGRKPTLDHFEVFGYDAYVHIAEKKRKKLDKKTHKCMMVSYSESSNAYKL